MSLGSRIEAFTKKSTKHMIDNLRGLPLKSTVACTSLMLAGGVAAVAFQDPSFVSNMSASTQEVGNIVSRTAAGFGLAGGLSSLAALAVSKVFKDPIAALDRWSNNNPADIIKKACWKEMKKEGNGQTYIKDRLDAMTPQQRVELNDYVANATRYAYERNNGNFTQMGVNVKPGFIAYDKVLKAERNDAPKQDVKQEKVQKAFTSETNFSF